MATLNKEGFYLSRRDYSLSVSMSCKLNRMKLPKILSILVVTTLALGACDLFIGPQGPPGETGPPGEAEIREFTLFQSNQIELDTLDFAIELHDVFFDPQNYVYSFWASYDLRSSWYALTGWYGNETFYDDISVHSGMIHWYSFWSVVGSNIRVMRVPI